MKIVAVMAMKHYFYELQAFITQGNDSNPNMQAGEWCIDIGVAMLVTTDSLNVVSPG